MSALPTGAGILPSVMDGGEQGGVATDQRRVLQREQLAVGSAAFPNPLIRQVHGPSPVHRGRPERGLGFAVEVAVQPGERLYQLLARLGVVDRMRAVSVLALAMDAPPVDLELGCLGQVRG